jgi:hypothetical protein
VLESATVVDEDGNPVDLKALDAELNRATMPDMTQLLEEMTVREEVVVDEDGDVVEVIEEIDLVEEIVVDQK